MDEDRGDRRGQTWWSKLSKAEKDAEVAAQMKKGLSNQKIADVLGLSSANQVAGPRHRINHANPNYTPAGRGRLKRLPSESTIEPRAPFLTRLGKPALEVHVNPNHIPAWKIVEQQRERELIDLMRGVKPPPEDRPILRLDSKDRRQIREKVRVFMAQRSRA